LPPELDELALGDPPEAWERLGFAVDPDGVVALGGVRLRLGADGQGIVGWRLRGMGDQRDLDGLTACPSDAPPPEPVEHPLGAMAIDHVVALTPDLDRTVRKFRAAGLDFRRIREADGGFRQAFFVLGPCLLELGGPAEGSVRFWGLTVVVDDLDAAAARLGDRLGRIKEAVQSGRRIATLKREAGLGAPMALMSPR
jgi:catechol 2,3-dioxygenase-like lactoylglutathione lyase family enzyme